MCPYEMCQDLPGFKRLDIHLLKVHKLKRNDLLYRKYIRVNKRNMKLQKPLDIKDIITDSLNDYENWLMSRKGGSLTNALAKQSKFKIRQIFCDLNITEIEEPLEKVKNIEEWICKYSDQYNPNSALVYLSVLINFSEYLLQNYPSIPVDRILRVKSSFNSLRKFMRKTIKKNHLINNDDLDKIKDTANFKLAEKYLQSRCQAITKKRHNIVRNYLLVNVILRNACRSGVLANLTTREFLDGSAQGEANSEYYIIQVSDHKTKSTDTAKMVLTKSLYENFQIYFMKFRAAIMERCQKPTDSTPNFFVTWSGDSLTSSHVNMCFKIFDPQLMANKIRKTVVTETYKSKSIDQREKHANHMKHLPSTAEKYYRQLIQNDKDSLETSNMVASILKQNNERMETKVVNDENYKMDIIDDQPEVLIILFDKNNRNSDKQMQAFNPNNENSGNSNDHMQHTGNSDECMQELNPNEKKEGKERSNSWIEQVLKDSGKGRLYFTIEERKRILYAFLQFLQKDEIPKKKEIDQIINEILHDLMSDVNSTLEKYRKVKGCLVNIINKKRNALK